MDDQQREIERLNAELAELRDRLAAIEADDIAKRKHFEEALAAFEQSYQEIFNAVTTAICVHEIPSGRIVSANQAMLDMFAYSREEMLGWDFWERATIGAPYDAQSAIAIVKDVVSTGPQTLQWPVRRRNGEEFWVEVTLKQATISGSPCVMSLLSDITDRRRAEEALKENERKLSAAVSIAKLGYWEYDVATDLFTFDDHFYAIFRTTVEEMGGYKMSSARYAESFLFPEDVHLISEEMNRAMETEDPHFCRQAEHRIRYTDGETGYIAVRYYVVKDQHGQTIKTYGANQDITERRRTEEALRASEQNYREIFNASMNSIALMDVDTGRFADVNPAMLELHGITREEAMQLAATDISVDQSSETQQQLLELIQKTINEGPQKFEWHCRKKNGQTFWTEVAMQGVTIGGTNYALAVASDITDRKEAQQRLLEEQQTLRQLLESQERERRLIAYEIHDGIAQQMAAAVMYCGSFEQLYESNQEEAFKSHEAGATMLQKALAETRRLIRGLRPTVLDESGLIAAIEGLVADLREKEGINVEFVHNVRFDRLDPVLENSLFRIAQESLTNAARHGRSEKIHIRLVEESDRLVLEVKDWGCGFDPEKVTSDGFGLKGIRERASLLGGTATVESKPDEGTRVHVELPLDHDREELERRG